MLTPIVINPRKTQENTNKINELTQSINKQLSFLGGRSFEELPSTDFSKIESGNMGLFNLTSRSYSL